MNIPVPLVAYGMQKIENKAATDSKAKGNLQEQQNL